MPKSQPQQGHFSWSWFCQHFYSSQLQLCHHLWLWHQRPWQPCWMHGPTIENHYSFYVLNLCKNKHYIKYLWATRSFYILIETYQKHQILMLASMAEWFHPDLSTIHYLIKRTTLNIYELNNRIKKQIFSIMITFSPTKIFHYLFGEFHSFGLHSLNSAVFIKN